MPYNWIDEGLQHEREWADQQRVASKHRLQQTSVIKEKGPPLMRELVAQVGGAVDEYRRKARTSSTELEFTVLPHEGFSVAKLTLPRVALECRPDYEAHALWCNMTRIEDQESEPEERLFSLDFTADESNTIRLNYGTRAFQTVDEAVECVLKTVLFPLWVNSLGFEWGSSGRRRPPEASPGADRSDASR